MKEKHVKILGSYLIFISLVHICIYVAMSTSRELGWLFYLDGRIAFFVIETVIRDGERTPPALISWIIELGILALGILMRKGPAFLKAFVLIEALLTLPYLLFFVVIFAANLGANHGFSRVELFLPSIVVIINSLLPVSYALWILWRSRQERTALI